MAIGEKDGMKRGGTSTGRKYVRTERSGSGTSTAARRKATNSTGNKPQGKANQLPGNTRSGRTVGGAEPQRVVRGGSPDVSGPKDVGSGRSAGATAQRAGVKPGLPAPATSTASKGAGAAVRGMGRLLPGVGLVASLLDPSPLNEGETADAIKRGGEEVQMHREIMDAPAKTSSANLPGRKPTPPAKRPAPSRRPTTPAQAENRTLTVEEKVKQLMDKGLTRTTATRLANAESGEYPLPKKFAKGGFVSKGIPQKIKPAVKGTQVKKPTAASAGKRMPKMAKGGMPKGKC